MPHPPARGNRNSLAAPPSRRHGRVVTDDPARQRLSAATDAWRAAPGDLEVRTRLARMLGRMPELAGPEHRDAMAAMLRDPAIDPAQFEIAGWVALADAWPGDAGDAARWIEQDDLAIALLEEAQVTDAEAERRLSAVRRWLLIEAQAKAFPRTAAALIHQAAINGGAWPFDADERAALAADPAFAPAYLPPPPDSPAHDYAAPVTQKVAAQYTGWPYPVWQRTNASPAVTLAATLAVCGPDAPVLPPRPKILVAGCGTGREASVLARTAPDADVLAIELSDASLALAREHCAGQPNLRFLRHDLHAVADLGERFDYISCGGVLHHLPDPEAGWAALVGVLAPGGAMRVALYSRMARLSVAAARQRLGDLMTQPVNDDLIREARRRLIADPVDGVTNSRDFFSTAGVHDLLFHTHEDGFDIPRIARAIDALGLRLLRFAMPDRDALDRYRAFAPLDPAHRNTAALHAFETHNPNTFAGMYRFTVAHA